MEAKVVRWGDGFAVQLTADDAHALGVSEGQTVELTPKRATNRAPLTLAAMIAEMERLGPAHRPGLVDWGPDVGAEIIRDDHA